MEIFQSKRITITHRQLNNAPPRKVFPLLCPVREKEWIDGWEYEMVYSKSGIAELGCVFTTPAPNNTKTTWYVTHYDPQQFSIGFVRMTPGEMVVKVFIQLIDNGNATTTADILYEYTALSEKSNAWIVNDATPSFESTMSYWERAINHYLLHGNQLPRN